MIQRQKAIIYQVQDKKARVRVVVDPNSQSANIRNIQKALDEAEQRRLQWEARQPEIKAQKTAEALAASSLQSCLFEWQLEL